jgi:hypothetical protein
MTYARAVLLALLLSGCVGNEVAEAPSLPADAPQTQKAAVAADVAPALGIYEEIGLPAYPGSTEPANTRLHTQSSTGDSYLVTYLTTDTPAQVIEYYKAQTAGLGTVKESIAIGEFVKSILVERSDGTQSGVKAATDGKGKTAVTVFRIVPKK